jgi:gliding motility-associated lipoprotein GldD
VPSLAQRQYQTFRSEVCPFTFEYPSSGQIVRNNADSCWVSIRFDRYDLTWHLTYRNASASGKPRAVHFEEYRRLVYQHSKKSSRIEENPFALPQGDGFLFEVYGEVGTPAQVFFSDSTQEDLLMLSFYYQDATTRDSLQPVTQYMKDELLYTLQSLQWRR